MKNLLSGFAISPFVLISMTGCENDPETLLTDGLWDFKNITTDSNDEDIIALVTLMKAALTDGYLEFNSDNTYLMDAPLLAEAVSGTWSLIGDDQLVLESNLGPSTANIETLSKTELKYIETYVDAEMNPYSVTTKWTRD